MRPAPVKTLDVESLMSFLGRQPVTHVDTTCFWGIEYVHVTPLGSLCVVSFDCPFGIFAAINHSHAYGFMLSPVSPPSKSSNLGVVLGTCHTGAT